MVKKLNANIIFVAVLIVVNAVLWFLPTGFEKAETGDEVTRCKAEIIKVDDTNIIRHGIVQTGTEGLKLKVINGKFKGKELDAVNQLKGQLEFDKMFKKGEIALIAIAHDKNKIKYVNVIDHYRLGIEIILVAVFVGILIILAGWTGVKATLSFIFTILAIWKILIPLFLKGYDPIWVSMIVVSMLTFVIIFLVANFTKRGLAAFMGSMLGMVLTCILAVCFGKAFKLHGAVVPFSETLLYSGYANLDITRIFFSGIFLASSGAVMDVAMDISSAVFEVVKKKPEIKTKEAIMSGISVARAVLGTMTTTLLLAYSGGYTALLMVFVAQGTPVINILNITYVAAEILHTLVGSFGLIMVAPFTAVVSGIIFTRKDIFSFFHKKENNLIVTKEKNV